MKKELLYSLTKKDFDIKTFRVGGKGGQRRDKVETGVSISHKASKAKSKCTKHRTQGKNKKEAFRNLINTREFKAWHKIETSMRLQGLRGIEQAVENDMKEENLEIEYGPFDV